MHTFILAIHIILAAFLVGLVLMQRSEGGALGGLGGGTGASFMTGRAVGNMLTRMTAIVATLFVITSLTLGIMAEREVKTQNALPALPVSAPMDAPVPSSVPANE